MKVKEGGLLDGSALKEGMEIFSINDIEVTEKAKASKIFADTIGPLTIVAFADPEQVESSEEESESEEDLDMGNMDLYEMSEPVDVFKQFNDTWCQKVLDSKKWNDRKKMIEEFLKFAEKNPKFANTRRTHMIQMIKNQMMNQKMGNN